MKYSDFFEFIKTTSERDQVVAELEQWQNNLYESKDRAGEVTLDVNILQWVNVQPDQAKAIKELISLLTAVTGIEITVACDLPEKSLKKIHASVVTLLKIPCILKITIDPVIVGGAQITFQGKCDEYFNLHRKQIIAQLKPQPGNEKLQ